MHAGVGSIGPDAEKISDEPSLHTARPPVYLDQWLWLRVANADLDEPRELTLPYRRRYAWPAWRVWPFRALRSARVLLCRQILCAMHLTFGRSAFQLVPPGGAVHWRHLGLSGRRGPLTLHGSSGRMPWAERQHRRAKW
jgi:hypothetical protein